MDILIVIKDVLRKDISLIILFIKRGILHVIITGNFNSPKFTTGFDPRLRREILGIFIIVLRSEILRMTIRS